MAPAVALSDSKRSRCQRTDSLFALVFVEVARGSRRAQRSEHTERHTCHFGGSRAFVPSRREAQLRSRKIRKKPIMAQTFATSPLGVRVSEGDWLHLSFRLLWQNDQATETPKQFAFPQTQRGTRKRGNFSDTRPPTQDRKEKKEKEAESRQSRSGGEESAQGSWLSATPAI